MQTDNGAEFTKQFTALKENNHSMFETAAHRLNIRLKRIKARGKGVPGPGRGHDRDTVQYLADIQPTPTDDFCLRDEVWGCNRDGEALHCC